MSHSSPEASISALITPRDCLPIAHTAVAGPRTLLMAAHDDDLVDPKTNTVALAERLRSAGTPVRLKMLSRVDHITVMASMAWPLRLLAPVREEVLRFVRQQA